jgi:hypothetical protein
MSHPCVFVFCCRELACLTVTPSEAIMAGNVRFSAEGSEADGAASSSSSSSPDAAPATAPHEAQAIGQ